MKNFNTTHNTVPFDQIGINFHLPAIEEAIQQADKNIDAIIEDPVKPTFKNTVEALEYSTLQVDRLQSVFFNLNSANTNNEMQKLAEKITTILTEFDNNIMLNEKLFERIREVYNEKDTLQLSVEEKKLLEDTYVSFVRSGANLDAGSKKIFRKLTEEHSRLMVKFSENVLNATNAFVLHITNKNDLSGLPGDIIQVAAETAKSRKKPGWIFTLKHPSYIPFMKYSENRELREKIYKAYNSRAYKTDQYDNSENIKKIVQIRLQIANLLGYTTYAEYILQRRMAESTKKVQQFLNEILEASKEKAGKELELIQQFAYDQGADFRLQKWDWAYYSEKFKKARYNIDDEVIKPYFSLEKVQNEIFRLITDLYGLTFRENPDIPVYQPDVKTFEVLDKDGSFLAVLYLDFFPSEGKQSGAWMTNYLEQYKTKAKAEAKEKWIDIRPHVSLVFNFPKPAGNKPSLLNYDELRTFLHEFGHGLHSILSDCKYQSQSGTNVYRDFVELPSQIFENWAEQKEWLHKVAVHYETGKTMPDELIQKIVESRNFDSGFASIRQILFGLLDMAWHTVKANVQSSIEEFEKKARPSIDLLPDVKNCAISTAFNHIFAWGYGAGYYSYKWAEVLDADAFSLFKEKGIFNKEIARSFRSNILSKGGTEHPMTLYRKFRGTEPSITALLKRDGLIAGE